MSSLVKTFTPGLIVLADNILDIIGSGKSLETVIHYVHTLASYMFTLCPLILFFFLTLPNTISYLMTLPPCFPLCNGLDLKLYNNKSFFLGCFFSCICLLQEKNECNRAMDWIFICVKIVQWISYYMVHVQLSKLHCSNRARSFTHYFEVT